VVEPVFVAVRVHVNAPVIASDPVIDPVRVTEVR
jgi:hypothetical protein